MRVSICGRRWNLRFVPRSRRRGYYGICDAPHIPNKTITIEAGHPEARELESLLHETLHAGAWNLSEETVTDWARDVARCLIKLGWHKRNGDQDTEV